MVSSLNAQSRAASFLTDNLHLAPRGKALDIAMGNGRNAVYLALNNYEVDGVDVDIERVKEATRLAASNGVSIKSFAADIERGEFNITVNNYDLIICFNYLHRALFPAIIKGLKPGGMVIYETYIVDQAMLGKPTNSDFLLKHNELLRVFQDFRCLHYREGLISPGKAAAGIVAQKPAI